MLNTRLNIDIFGGKISLNKNKVYATISLKESIRNQSRIYGSSKSYITMATNLLGSGYVYVSGSGKMLMKSSLNPTISKTSSAISSINMPNSVLITKGNMKYFALENINFKKDDILIIDMEKQTITLNSKNILNNIDRNSEFFEIKGLDNRLNFECIRGSQTLSNPNLDVYVRYYHKYV